MNNYTGRRTLKGAVNEMINKVISIGTPLDKSEEAVRRDFADSCSDLMYETLVPILPGLSLFDYHYVWCGEPITTRGIKTSRFIELVKTAAAFGAGCYLFR